MTQELSLGDFSESPHTLIPESFSPRLLLQINLMRLFMIGDGTPFKTHLSHSE